MNSWDKGTGYFPTFECGGFESDSVAEAKKRFGLCVVDCQELEDGTTSF
jgi:hypothetical protein